MKIIFNLFLALCHTAWLFSPTSQKISTWKNLAGVAAEEQNGPGLWNFAVESGSDWTEIAY